VNLIWVMPAEGNRFRFSRSRFADAGFPAGETAFLFGKETQQKGISLCHSFSVSPLTLLPDE
jgi:hypothetical protein